MSKRKFKYGISCPVPVDKRDEISQALELIGIKRFGSPSCDDSSHTHIKIYDYPSDGVFNFLPKSIAQVNDYINLESYNKDLILALAAMIDSEEFYVGEKVVVKNNHGLYRTGVMHTISTVGKDQLFPMKPFLKVDYLKQMIGAIK